MLNIWYANDLPYGPRPMWAKAHVGQDPYGPESRMGQGTRGALACMDKCPDGLPKKAIMTPAQNPKQLRSPLETKLNQNLGVSFCDNLQSVVFHSDSLNIKWNRKFGFHSKFKYAVIPVAFYIFITKEMNKRSLLIIDD